MIKRLIIFLLINFAALALGSLFTSSGVISDWYQQLNQAPWTPPGWVFGVAWTSIMVCFSFYMAYALLDVMSKAKLLLLFSVQWVLNVIWNPIFFHFHLIGLGLVAILLLTFIVGYMLFFYWPVMKQKSLFLVPYFLWLLVASSLNGYILFNN
jgi:tryptophan-rich sensory protein